MIMKKTLFSLYIIYKITFNRPIYRVDILRYVKYIEQCTGLCYSIRSALSHCNVYKTTEADFEAVVSRFFPLMLRKKRRAL